MPQKPDRWLRYLKYVVLIVVLYLTYMTGQLIIRPYDPWATLHHFTSDELLTGYAWGLGILILTIVGSFFYKRFFCKYLCPMGAFLAILSKIGITKIKRDAEFCTDCKICDKECPVNIEVSTKEKVTSAECISCNKCVTACPAKGALKIGAGKGKKGLNALSTISIVIIVFLVVLIITNAIGMFRVSKIPKGFPLKSYGLYISEEYITENNNLAEVCYAFGLNPQYFMVTYGYTEEDFFKSMKDIDFDHHIIVDLIQSIPESSGCGSSGCE
jgi:NAD-dependent dihydropyrimidine dehydrogenase PreA subunit